MRLEKSFATLGCVSDSSVHMNGRVYDYNLGRFLSVDPFIQAPGNSQSMNPYSYIMNNPLAGTDPSGYKAEKEKFKGREGSGSICKRGGGVATGCQNVVINPNSKGSVASNNGAKLKLTTTVSGGAKEVEEVTSKLKEEGYTSISSTENEDGTVTNNLTIVITGGTNADNMEFKKEEGKSANLSDKAVKKMARRLKGYFKQAKIKGAAALKLYCAASPTDCSGFTVKDFENANFNWEKKMFFRKESKKSKGFTGAYVDRSGKIPVIRLYSGGIALQGNGISVDALAEVLIHEFRHVTPHGESITKYRYKNNKQIPYKQRPHEIDAFAFSKRVMKHAN